MRKLNLIVLFDVNLDDKIKEPRKRLDYTMRYLIMSEMIMFLSEGKTIWYLSMLELKLVANNMAISIMNKMIKREIIFIISLFIIDKTNTIS